MVRQVLRIAASISRWIIRVAIKRMAPRAAIGMTAAGGATDYHSTYVFHDLPAIEQHVTPVEELEVIDLAGTFRTHPTAKFPRRDPSVVESIVWHHTATNGQGIGFVNDIHIGRGWEQISYSIVVDYRGRVHITGHPSIAAYHCAGFNSRSVGGALLGNFHERELPEAMEKKGIPAARTFVREQWGITVEYLHKDKVATACPGRFAERVLRP